MKFAAKSRSMQGIHRTMKILFLYYAAVFLAVASFSPLQAQTDKDVKSYEKLEIEIRKDLDKLISQFKPMIIRPDPTPLVVDSSYDKFKDITTVGIGPRENDRQSAYVVRVGNSIAVVNLYANYSYPGQQPIKPTSINLIFTMGVTSASWLEPNPSFIVIAENKRYKLGNMSQNVLPTGRVLYAISVPYDILAEISRAESIEAQMGNIDFRIVERDLYRLRLIAGVPSKSPRESIVSPGRLENTLWKGKNITADFKLDGTLNLQGAGLGDRSGTWHQENDRVQIDLPASGPGWGGHILAVGIIKGDKVALRYMVRDLLGFGVSKNVVMQLSP